MLRAKPANSCLIISPGTKFGSSFTPGKPPTQWNEGHLFAFFFFRMLHPEEFIYFFCTFSIKNRASPVFIQGFVFWLKTSRWFQWPLVCQEAFCCFPLMTNWSLLVLCTSSATNVACTFYYLMPLIQTDINPEWNIPPQASQYCPLGSRCQLRSLLSGVFLYRRRNQVIYSLTYSEMYLCLYHQCTECINEKN